MAERFPAFMELALEDRIEFANLAEDWESWNNFMGCADYGCPPYIALLSFGKALVPLALARMRRTGSTYLMPAVLSLLDGEASKLSGLNREAIRSTLIRWGIERKLI